VFVDLAERDNGERKDCHKKDLQFNEQASDFLQAKKWVSQEGPGAFHPLRSRSWTYCLLRLRQALRFCQL
jgi:hypothetical protein